MGRKSAKGKERKLRRKEENEITEHLWKLVAEANKIDDPLAPLVSFQKYNKNGLNLTISCHKRESVEEDILLWALNLTKSNMESLYEESGWGWKDRDKLQEMKDDNARYLIVKNEDEKPVAFIHFRFDLDYGQPVVYCYEIQLESEVRNKGLGFFLMQILQLFAIKNSLFKVSATILRINDKSMDFFMRKLKFTEDETSPDDECYMIVSKLARVKT
ncbi:N-alpha-acetyltransferase 40-like isoform X2 [Styela clava]